ncbi:MAG: hypothetical protein K2O06_10620 [Acetatifactor sp.]|nr:hypothetical protein [Acetatifactor sp.]
MGNVNFFLRYAGILFVLSLFTLFFVEAGTLEFKVTAVSAVISFLISVSCIVKLAAAGQE